MDREAASELNDDLALERQVCFALAAASRSVISLYRPLLEPMGLTHPQYLVMLALWGSQPLCVKDLSRLLQLEPATLSPLLKRLEVAGYVRRQRDPADERSLRVTLTDSGLQLRERARSVPGAVREQLQMGRQELDELHETLTNVIGQVQGPAAGVIGRR